MPGLGTCGSVRTSKISVRISSVSSPAPQPGPSPRSRHATGVNRICRDQRDAHITRRRDALGTQASALLLVTLHGTTGESQLLLDGQSDVGIGLHRVANSSGSSTTSSSSQAVRRARSAAQQDSATRTGITSSWDAGDRCRPGDAGNGLALNVLVGLHDGLFQAPASLVSPQPGWQVESDGRFRSADSGGGGA
jgi:hypothetical protein